MALIDVVCADGHVSEVYRSVHDWPQTPPCPTCQGPTEQTMLPKSVRWTPDPVIVYKAPDGFRFPGDPNGISAKMYERMGYERVEIRGAAEMRSFESRMSKTEYSKAMRKAEREQRVREERESAMRSNLRDQMRGMSERGKAIARAAMAYNDAKPRERAKESGFISECYSYDSSNRMESRDAQGRRRRS